MSHLEEIKMRLNIEELVGSYVQLKKAGRNLKGLCPFHSEKTPSFMVSPEKGIAYCFGCHKGGDIFKFTQLVENVEFGEAVKLLAERTNVQLPTSLPQAHNKRLRGLEINQATAAFYQDQLNEKHKEYFYKRGLTDETIKAFQLGFAPDSFDQLKNHLSDKGFQNKELIDSGVMNQRSIADQNFYDRFRNRLIFPIFDHQNNPVAFSGRIMGEGEPKYLNSPDSPTYNKSLVLYGLNWGKDAIKETGTAIFVEGYMDVIAAHQAGTKNVVATCGTALTPQQLKLIQRYAHTIAFAFDQDSAGMEATFRGIELAQMTNLKLRVIQIPNGKDPDECIQENPENWKTSVENPIGVMDFYFNYALQRWSKDDMEGKKEIMKFLLPLIKTFKSNVERGEYLNRLAIEIKTDVKLLWSDLNNTRINTPQNRQVSEEKVVKNEPIKFSREAFLLGFIFNYPEKYSKVAEHLIDNIPFDPSTERFYSAIKKVYTLQSSVSVSEVKAELSDEEQERVAIYTLLIDEHYPDFSDNAVDKEMIKLIREINRKNLQQMQKEFEYQIRTTEDQQEKKVILNRYNELLKLSTKI